MRDIVLMDNAIADTRGRKDLKTAHRSDGLPAGHLAGQIKGLVVRQVLTTFDLNEQRIPMGLHQPEL